MCGVSPIPLAEHENDDICAEALLSLQNANEQELDRFYCPFPGCKRSFAELWWVSSRLMFVQQAELASTGARGRMALAKIVSMVFPKDNVVFCAVLANAGG